MDSVIYWQRFHDVNYGPLFGKQPTHMRFNQPPYGSKEPHFERIKPPGTLLFKSCDATCQMLEITYC